jgi:hypothetical protein
MFAFFDDSKQRFIMILNSFDLFECSDIISIESNDLQHDADFDAIRFEIMIDSNIVSVAENSQIVSNFESKLIKLSSSLAVGLGFGQKFKPDPRVDVRPD